MRNFRRAGLVVAAALFVVVLVVGLRQAPKAQKSDVMTLSEMRGAVRGAPPALEVLHRQASELLPGGYSSVRRRIRALRGRPVVVNLWASWCPPCRAEASLFQRVSTEFGTRVAFIGVNENDNITAANAFLKKVPLLYPSYVDRPQRMARHLRLQGLPGTVFFGRNGRQVTLHQGQYLSVDALRAAVDALL